MKNIKDFEAVIFDMDGTILDSMGMWASLGSDFLKSYGVNPPSDIDDIIMPMGMYESAKYFVDNFDIDLTVEEIVKQVYASIENQYKHHLQLKPFVYDYFKSLHEKGIKMCVATATDKTLAEAVLKRVGALELLEFVITCDEVGVGKEQPTIYLKSVEGLGSTVEKTVIFEDAIHCINTAKKAGFTVVGVHDTSSAKHMDVLKEKCDKYIMGYEELV